MQVLPPLTEDLIRERAIPQFRGRGPNYWIKVTTYARG